MAAISQPVAICSQTSPAAPGNAVTTGVTGFSFADAITIIAELQGATGGALDVCVQHSPDGVAWYDYVHFTQLAAAASAVKYSFVPSMAAGIVTIGASNTAITLAANSAAGGLWFDQLRVLLVAGASTTAGATQTVTVLAHRS